MSFILPENPKDLLKHTSGQYYVEEIVANRYIPIKLQEAKSSLLRSNGTEIEPHFDAFFSIVSKFVEIESTTKLLAWTILKKGAEAFGSVVGKVLSDQLANNGELDSSQQRRYLDSLKMYVYLLVEMLKSYQAQLKGNSAVFATPAKGKKGKSKTSSTNIGMDWEKECQCGVQLLMNFVDLDIHRLWETQIVEDEFTSLISNICYLLMEDSNNLKNKSLKTTLIHLLGCLIKKYKQSLSATLKLLQLLQHFEHTAAPLSEAVQLWVESYKCKTLMSEIIRELSQIPERELTRDSSSTRTMCSFVLELAKLLPSELLSNISLLLPRMDEESYMMRNTVLGVMGEILIQCLSGEGLDDKAKTTRDQFLDILYDHANLDVNAFVRSRSIHIYLNLVEKQCLPIRRCPDIVDLCVRLLLDRSNLVRKATVQLLEGLLRWNPFAATLPIQVLQGGLDEAKQKLAEMQQAASASSNQGGRSPSSTSTQSGDEVGDVDEAEQIEQVEDEATEKQKSIITYLSESVRFVEKFHEAVPVLCQLLRSRTSSDVLEAINFFTAAWEFQLSFAVKGIAEMLDQIWNDDQKIRDAVVFAYKELYFKQTSSLSSSSLPSHVADNMIILVASSSGTRLQAVQALIGHMQKSRDLPPSVSQIFWERFVRPPSSFTMEKGISELKQQKVIAQLLAMLAHDDPAIVKPKLDVLVQHGLQVAMTHESAREVYDYELAKNTCVVLSKLAARKTQAGKYVKPFRLPNDHPMFVKISELLTTGFDKESKTWIRFALEALGVIFQLSAYPIKLSTSIFNDVRSMTSDYMLDGETPSLMKEELLTRFFHLCGHSALKLLIFVDGDVQAELKQRRNLQDEKDQKAKIEKHSKSPNKDDSNLEEDLGVGGATADDADQEFIKSILETEIVGPGCILGNVSELIVRCCMLKVDRDNITGVRMQQSATLALAKYMLVSAEFCERHLRMYFTLLESSPHEGVRANLIIAAGDLCIRFPNLLEPWTAKIYARLNDPSNMVQVYGIKVLTSLILNDMIKVKGHVSEMARCIVDENERISMLAKKFFQELSKKGNSVYNVMPDIISRLSDPEEGLKDDVDFKSIMRFLFEFIQKDRQTESLVEKLCHRFKATRAVQQWRDLAFCLSLLNYNEKAMKRLMENFSFYSGTLRDEQVYFAFNNIMTKSKKFAKPELKSQIDELEVKILDFHAQGVSEDESEAKAAQASKQYKVVPRSPSVSQTPGADRNAKTTCAVRTKVEGKRRTLRTRAKAIEFSSDDDDDFDNDIKENVKDDVIVDDDSPSTPIRRLKTPRRATRSLLRA